MQSAKLRTKRGRGGSEAKPNPLRLATQSTSPRVGGLIRLALRESSASAVRGEIPKVTEPAGKTLLLPKNINRDDL